jgi:hypothetical protein
MNATSGLLKRYYQRQCGESLAKSANSFGISYVWILLFLVGFKEPRTVLLHFTW